MKLQTNQIALISLLAAFIAISGMIKLPSLIPGTEFQMSAPIAVAIAAAFGFWRYLAAGILASLLLFLLGVHHVLNIEVSMVFRLVAGGVIAVFGPKFAIVALAGPIGTTAARWTLSLTLGVPLFPLLLGAIPGMVFTAMLSWPLYQILKLVKERAGKSFAGRTIQHPNESR
ncbi:hypothetical protein [Bacillus xiapuensis]|uniref:hypothetical protein n=1 Tax=Bacillus xiapuensis TaxID=2014075 RepID=UPI000C235199|nr:hypothetical protein [Bacillus xiapuensis]